MSVVYTNKKMRLSEWIKKQDPTLCCLQETHFKYEDTHRLKEMGYRKICHTNTNQKKVGVAVLISDRADFKARNDIRYKKGCYMIIKGSILLRYNNP